MQIKKQSIIQVKYWVIFLAFISCLELPAQVRLTYIGNMGVLLEGDGNTVLIDGLHQRYGEAYQYPTDAMVEDLITDGGQYPQVQISLVTHYHGDHFNGELSSRLTQSLVIGSEQVASQLADKGFNNVQVVAYVDYQKQGLQHRGINVDAFRMDHVNKSRHARVQNIGYLLNVGGKKVLHVGDSDWYEEMLKELDLRSENIDIAILPVWMLMNDRSRALLDQYISPRHLLITHIDPSATDRDLAPIQAVFPKARFLMILGEQISY